ncbi:cellulose binding domain-containing protein [Caenispirillum salinarum]|uniref:cellulose binding domain-containing protein n=1 Tax=Caenispirillum salinarum TaxID=859058 RepID=UPI00384F1B8F
MTALIDYIITSEWNGGYVIEVSVANTGNTTIQDYKVGFTLPAEVDTVWNGVVTDHSGDAWVVMDDDEKNDLRPGETITFKMKVLTTRDGIEPANFTVNGELAEMAPRPDETPDAFVDGVAVVAAGTSAAEIQALLDKAPEGGVVRLEAGTFTLDAQLTITRSDVTLEGAGSGRTTIVFTDAALDDGPGIHVAGTKTVHAGGLHADVVKGQTTITLTEDYGLWVGDTVRLWQDNDTEFLNQIEDWDWRMNDVPLRTSMAKVVAIDGGTVTLDRGVHFAMEASLGKVERMDTLSGVALQGFDVRFQLGTPDYTLFENVHTHLDRYRAIELEGTVGARVADVGVYDGPSVAFEFTRSMDMVADRLTARGAFNKGDNGNGYAYELRESYDGVFTKLQDGDMRHGVVFASWASSVNNKIHVDYTDRDVNFHGGRDTGNVVHVEKSLREAAADDISTTVWWNDGETFGAPTDRTANQVLFDYVIGSRRDDDIQGVDTGVYLNGRHGHDTLRGGAGDDILEGGRGDDLLLGGDGVDTARYERAFSDYVVSYDGQGRVLIDGYASDDILVDVEKAVFADGTTLDLKTLQATPGVPTARPTPDEIVPQEDVYFPGSTPATQPQLTATTLTESRWSAGYVMAVEITNHGDEPLADPQVSFRLPVAIDTLYGARLVSRSGDTYTIAGELVEPLEPGATMRFCFKAYDDVSHEPAALTVNGMAVEAGAALPDPGTPAVADETGGLDPNTLTQVTSEITSSWSTGYVTEVTITNTSDVPVDDAAVTFDLPAVIDTIYSAVLTDHGNGRYTIHDDSGPINLGPGESWSVKYKVYDDARPLPKVVSVDGHADLGLAGIGLPDPTMKGTSADETLNGTSGDDVIDGRGGADTFAGGLGDDIYRVDSSADRVVEWAGQGRDIIDTTVSRGLEAGVEVLRAIGSGSLSLTGNMQANVLVGNAADNVLSGGLGRDAMEGGAGADVFHFGGLLDSRADAPDVIVDFRKSDGDRIDLSTVDADALTEGDQAFTWTGDGGFSGVAGELRREGDLVQADVDGDGVVDMAIEVRNASLDGGDFLL